MEEAVKEMQRKTTKNNLSNLAWCYKTFCDSMGFMSSDYTLHDGGISNIRRCTGYCVN